MMWRATLCVVAQWLIACAGPTAIGTDKACLYQRIVVLSLLPQQVTYRRLEAGGKSESLDVPVGMLLNQAAWNGVKAAFRNDYTRELVIISEDLERHAKELSTQKFGVSFGYRKEHLIAIAAGRNADAVLLVSQYILRNRGLRGIDGLFYLGLGDKQYVTAAADLGISLFDRNGEGIVESRSDGVRVPVVRIDGTPWTFELSKDTDVVGHRSFTQMWQKVLPRVIEGRIQQMGLTCSKGTQLGDLIADFYQES
jgi:hypothetical protein